MNATINNIIENMRSNANDARHIIRQVSRIPGVDIATVRAWNAPTTEEISAYKSVRFDGFHAEFTWHDAIVTIDESFDGCLSVRYNDQLIGKIYWSACTGDLVLTTNPDHLNTKAQEWVAETIYKVVYRISVKGRTYKKYALPNAMEFGEYRIYTEYASIYARNKNGEVFRVCGNKYNGNTYSESDIHVFEIGKIMRRAFMK